MYLGDRYVIFRRLCVKFSVTVKKLCDRKGVGSVDRALKNTTMLGEKDVESYKQRQVGKSLFYDHIQSILVLFAGSKVT